MLSAAIAYQVLPKESPQTIAKVTAALEKHSWYANQWIRDRNVLKPGLPNEICVRMTQAGQPMDLHRFWDGVNTSSSNLTHLRNEATALRNRQEFQRSQLTELASTGFESWGQRRASRLRRRLLTGMGGGLGVRRVGLWTARWSRRLRRFLWAIFQFLLGVGLIAS
jgi:hypothetical protein